MILLELSGDGGFSRFTKKEQDDMYNFLIKLKNNQNMTNEEKAKRAANIFCRCYKCDKIAHNNISEYEPAVTFKCDKSKLKTCLRWYYGYRTALIALNMEDDVQPQYVECNNCKCLVEYTDNDVKSDVYVVCPDCKEKIILIE